MKKLKKILLVKWLYYENELIEVGDITFLTGKTGAGKSTVVDALQVVLLGETNSRNFNKAASDTSQRTLDTYLRADMDGDGPKCRRGKDFSSYIACEYWDDKSGERFTAGIVFDCRADGSRRDQYFLYDGPIPDTHYIVNRKAMDIAALRAWLKEQPFPSKMYDSNRAYRDDLMAKWNVHSEQVCRMLKKAVSFKPIGDIQKFITENICDTPDRPDIDSMQQNIRDYKRHEELARRQEEKLELLQNIAKLFQNWHTAYDRLQLHRFLSQWAEKESLEQEIAELQQQIIRCQGEIEAGKQHTLELEAEIAQCSARREELIEERANDDRYQKPKRLEARKEQLEQEQSRLTDQIRKTILSIQQETAVLTALRDKIESWPELEQLSALCEAADALADVCRPLAGCGPELFAGSMEIFHEAKDQTRAFAEHFRRAAFELDTELRSRTDELQENQETLEGLRRQKKDYPTALLSLKHQLELQLLQKYERPIPVEILADVLEIADGEEKWRGAVEGYLGNQKFYLLVEPEAYADALTIYNETKEKYRENAYGLVDVGKLREKENCIPREDSLAKKVQTDNPLARSYVDYLLGRVVCCNSVDSLRSYSIAITAEGMLYQGYVARPLPESRMKNTFIGKKAIELRIQSLSQRQRELEAEIGRLKPICGELERKQRYEFLFTSRFLLEAEQRQADYLREQEIRKELAQVEEELSHVDLLWLARIDSEIDGLKARISQLQREKDSGKEKIGGMEQEIAYLERERIPERREALQQRESALQENFSGQYTESVGLPRYQQELERLKQPAVVARNFGNLVPRTESETNQAQGKLFEARRVYIQRFQPCPFRETALDNEEFDRELQWLAESELPQYREKIRLARESALEQFQNDFLSRLRDSIQAVQGQVKNLNRALKQAQFGTERYEFKVERNPDYADYFEMIMSSEWMGEGGLFAIPFQQKYGPLVEELFSRITASDDTRTNLRQQTELQKNIERYTDYRTYLKFDLETTDQNGKHQLLSQTLNLKSGGETQTPFYIAVLASFAQLYRVSDTSSFGNTVRLIVFDEAFNKMDSDRIIESVRLLRKLGLQAIICTPPDKIGDIMPEADRTVVALKERYTMKVLPFSKEMVDLWSEA